jgi:hypothetical protein
MESATDVPRSYSIRRRVPAYRPAKTPHVGLRVTFIPRYENTPVPYVVIREVDTDRTGNGSYWVAPVLPDGTLGKMTTAPLTKHELNT